MRKAHYLTSNSKGEGPSRLVYFDTETHSQQISDTQDYARLTFGYACFERLADGKTIQEQWIRFHEINQFWDWLESRTQTKTKTYCFAHNLGGFDMMVLEFGKQLSSRGWICRSLVLECPPTIITYSKMNKDRVERTLIFIDSLNFFRMSLKVLGDSMGYPKLEMPEQTASKEEWNIYCKQDVTILKQAIHNWLDFCELNDLGNFKTTLPSQAFTAYRHRFMKHNTLFCDTNPEALRIAREGYYGGRTECFYIGKKAGTFYLLDINSMYPYVMANNKFPVKLVSVLSKTTKKELQELMNRYYVIADLNTNTTEPEIPKRYEDKLLFPIGNLTTVVHHPEINPKDIIEINKVILYEQDYIFKEYCNYFYNLRKHYKSENNMAYSDLSKLMLNSLYGKFGQRGFIYENIGETPLDEFETETIVDADTGIISKERAFGGVRQKLTQESESSNSIPAIAGAVTSYARHHLWTMIKQAGRGNVFYCDTDSVLVNSIGYANLSLIIGDGLGQLKLEQTFHNIDIRTLKDYTFDDKVRIKGVRKDAKDLGLDSFGKQQYLQTQFRSLKGALRNGDVNNMIISMVHKTLQRDYNKGIIDKSGKVRPIKL